MSRSRVRLSRAFTIAARQTPIAPDTLEEALQDLWQTAVAAWPGVVVAPPAFMSWLGERVPAGADLLASLRMVHATDLYLACACALGDRAALLAFEREYVHRVPAYLARGKAPSDFIEEVQQQLRTRLFTTARGQRPKIAAYSGRGPLGAFVRITTVRTAMDLSQERRRRPSGYEFEAQALAPAITDPELAALRTRHGAVLNKAVQAALASLLPRDATLLRLFFLQDISHDALARMYHVPKSRVRRWLAAIRTGIIEETRRHLVDELSLSRSRVDSLIRLASSDLDTSIVRFLERRA